MWERSRVYGQRTCLIQVAAVAALVGMALGWRGVMTRYAGFYDLPTAWNQILGHRDWRSVWLIFQPGFCFPHITAIIEENRITLH